jgi:glycosyltransferase involved in cell wall biosynthesis
MRLSELWKFCSMKILFLADNFPPERNAQASRVYERACYWVNWGHDVTVLTCAPNFPEGKVYPGYANAWYRVEEMSGIRVVRVKTFVAANSGTVLRILDFLSFMLAALVAGLIQRKGDVIAVTSPQFFAAVAACALAWIRGVPFVMEVSDLWPDSIAAVGAMKKGFALRMIEKLELLMYSRAERIIPLTHSFKRNLTDRGVPAGKIDVVINGVDLGRYAPRPRNLALAEEWGIFPGEFVIGYVGTHGMAHALGNVLDAAERTNSGIRWLLVGNGAEREKLVARATRCGLRNLTMIPAQPKERMPDVWSLCDIALVHLRDTALFETVIPSKIFEAMGMGLPILLACPSGEASRLIADSGAGLCVTPEDPDDLANAAILLATNPELTRKYASRSLAAAPRYSRERQARDYMTALEKALAPKLGVEAIAKIK